MATPRVKLTWQDTNELEQGHRIYRGDAYFTADEAPALIAEVGPDVTEYVDTTVVDGQQYWYRVSAKFPNYEIKSDAGLYTAYSIAVSPGSMVFSGGDATAGFLGEVSTVDLIAGNDLATHLGLTVGTAYNSEEPWLKFAIDGKVIYVAKKPFRSGTSWNDINAVDAVYGNRTIEIGGQTFKIRLIKGGDADPASAAGGEWNRLIYNVHTSVPVDQVGTNWASYTDADLWVNRNTTGEVGKFTVSMETGTSSGGCVLRGYESLTYFNNTSTTSKALRATSVGTQVAGWRPVLELVE